MDEPSTTAVERRVARRVATLRREVGLTLRELGARTGMSDAYLSRVENGQAAITLASLEKLAAVFATPITTFFAGEDEPERLVICRREQGRKARFRGREGTRVELLAAGKHAKMMEPLIVDPGSSRAPVAPMGHPGEEFNYILEGRCRFLFGDEVHELAAGDAVYFDATVPHAVHAVPGVTCRFLAVVTSRDFDVHRDIARVLETRIQA